MVWRGLTVTDGEMELVSLASVLPPPALLPPPPPCRRAMGTATATMRATTTNTTRPSPSPKRRCFRPHLWREALASSTVKSSSDTSSSSSSVVSSGIPSLKDMLIYKISCKWLPSLIWSSSPRFCRPIEQYKLRHVTCSYARRKKKKRLA